ncbi:hypothetical protein KBD71_03260 [Candidatus Woesebacteria bacterium]|nr:hypothetical protein [Candidatus Woesebacteria bacterium]
MPKRIDNEADMRRLRSLIFNDEQMDLQNLSNRSKITISEDPDRTGVTSASKSKHTEKRKLMRNLGSELSCGCQLILCYYGGCLAYSFFLAVAPALNVVVDTQTTHTLIMIDIGLWVTPFLLAAGAADSQSRGG